METTPSILSRVVKEGTKVSSCSSFKVMLMISLFLLGAVKLPMIELPLRDVGFAAMVVDCHRELERILIRIYEVL